MLADVVDNFRFIGKSLAADGLVSIGAAVNKIKWNIQNDQMTIAQSSILAKVDFF